MGEKGVIPAQAGIQVFEIVEIYNILDARLRGRFAEHGDYSKKD
jgi:hypothetical protein